MIEVFYAPMLSNNFRDLSYCFSVDRMGCSKQADGHLGFGSFFFRAVNPSAFNDLGYMGKGANFGIQGDDGDVPNLKSAVAVLEFSDQPHRTIIEKFFSVFVIV